MDVLQITEIIIIALVGLIFASFTLCYADRYKVRSMMTRSVCDQCGQELSPVQLIPLFGAYKKCSHCNAIGGKAYLFSEIAYAGVFTSMILLLLRASLPLETIVFFGVISVLILSQLTILFMVDLRHKVFPDEILKTLAISTGALVVGLVALTPHGYVVTSQLVMELLIVSGMWSLPFLLLSLLSQEKYMGYGDGIVMIFMGAIFVVFAHYLNPQNFVDMYDQYAFYFSRYIYVLFGASVLGFLAALIENYSVHKKIFFKKSQEIPFGPPLIVSYIIVLIFFLNQ